MLSALSGAMLVKACQWLRSGVESRKPKKKGQRKGPESGVAASHAHAGTHFSLTGACG